MVIDYDACLLDSWMKDEVKRPANDNPAAFALIYTVDKGVVFIWDYFGRHEELVEEIADKIEHNGYIRLKMCDKNDAVPHYVIIFKGTVLSVSVPTVDIIGG